MASIIFYRIVRTHTTHKGDTPRFQTDYKPVFSTENLENMQL